MARTKKQPDLPDLTTAWAFRAKFRARAFGWKGSKLAIERLKQALTEIKVVGRHDPLRAADGAVLLIERISAAFEQIDSSSGALGTAVNKLIAELVAIIAAAPAPEALRRHWLDRLFEALQSDQVPYARGPVGRAVRHADPRHGYELTRTDLLEAFREAMGLAEKLGEAPRLMAWMQQAATLRTEASGWLHGFVGPPRPRSGDASSPRRERPRARLPPGRRPRYQPCPRPARRAAPSPALRARG